MTEKKALDLTKVKKGDEIRYLGGDPEDSVGTFLEVGKVYFVSEYSSERLTIDLSDSDSWCVGSFENNLHCFELDEEDGQEALVLTRVKVGDKIRYLGGDLGEVGELVIGKEYTVHRATISEVYIESSLGDSWGVGVDFDNLHCFELVEDSTATEGAPTSADPVDNPSHYNVGKFETIEVIEEVTQHYNDGFISHCVGTAIKYISRAPHKHATPLEDLRKAAAYLEYAIERQSKIEASMVCEEEKIVWNESF